MAEHPVETMGVAPPHPEERPPEQPPGSVQEFEPGDHALGLPHVPAWDQAQHHPEELRALEDHFHVEVHEGAVTTPECYAADPPSWPSTPDSGATLHGTTCTRAPFPCSGSPE